MCLCVCQCECKTASKKKAAQDKHLTFFGGETTNSTRVLCDLFRFNMWPLIGYLGCCCLPFDFDGGAQSVVLRLCGGCV